MRAARNWELYDAEKQAERLEKRAQRNQELAFKNGQASDEKVWWTVVMAAREAARNLRSARAVGTRKGNYKTKPRPDPPEPRPIPVNRDWQGVPEKIE